MVIVGLLLLLAAGIFGVDLAVKNRFSTRDLYGFGEDLGISGSAHIYVLGAITGAAIIIGVTLVVAGLGRKQGKATERRRVRETATTRTSEVERLRAENTELRSRVDQGAMDQDEPANVGSEDRSIPAAPQRDLDLDPPRDPGRAEDAGL